MKSKDQSIFQGQARAIDIINSLAMACMSMITFAYSSDYHEIDSFSDFYVEPLSSNLTIRGSFVSSIISNLVIASDIDTIIKLPIDSSVFLSDFSEHSSIDIGSFCKASIILALKSLFPELIDKTPITKKYENHVLSFSWSKTSQKIIDYVSGIFGNFCIIDDKSKCILSFPSHDYNGQKVGLDLDITLQFIPSKRYSPLYLSSKSPLPCLKSPVEENNQPEDSSTYYLNDACSFAHDAIEIVVPLDGLKCDSFAQAYFAGLFGFKVPDVCSYLTKKELKIINPNMHQGVIRTVYEICKGKVPIMEDGADFESEMLCHILQSSNEKDIHLDNLHKFVVKKSQGKMFFFNVFLNCVHLMNMIKENISNHASADLAEFKPLIDKFMLSLDLEIKKSRFLENIPEDLSEIAKLKHPTKVFGAIAELQTHFSQFDDSRIAISQNHVIKISGFSDKSSGFVISKFRNLTEIKNTISFLKKSLPHSLFDSIRKRLLLSVENICYLTDETWNLLYFLRIFEMKITDKETVSQIAHSFPDALILIDTYQLDLKKLKFIPKFINFVCNHANLLFDEPAHVSKLVDFINKNHSNFEENPHLFIGFMTKLFHVFSKQIELEFPLDLTRFAGEDIVGDVILSIALRQKFKKASDYIPYILLFSSTTKTYTLYQMEILSDLISKLLIHPSLEEVLYDHKEEIRAIFSNLIESGGLAFFSYESCSQLLIQALGFDRLYLATKHPFYFDLLSPSEKWGLILELVKNQKIDALENVALFDPKLATDIFKSILSDSYEPQQFISWISKSPNIRHMLLKNEDWLLFLNEKKAKCLLDFLGHCQSEIFSEQAINVITSIVNSKPVLGIKCALHLPM